MLAYSIDDKGGEYFTIFVRRISDNKIVEKIEDTAGGIVWAYDDKSFFYRKNDSQKRPRQIFQHKLGTNTKEDKLIFEEKDERFTCTIDTTSCEQFYLIETSEHTTSEIYFFHKDEKLFNPKIFLKREEGILYNIDSFGDHRIAMAASIGSIRANGETTILDCLNVNTSFPNFIDVCKQVGINIKAS